MRIFDRLEAAWDAGVDRLRQSSRTFDHVWRAQQRYSDLLGGRLAAAIAYYGFFAVFALALLAYSVVGYVLAADQNAVATVNKFLQANIPFLDASQIADSRQTVAVIGLVSLVFTGVGWIETLRSSQRAIWHLNQQPGYWFIRRLVDLGILVGVGLLLALSLWVQSGINDSVVPVLFGFTPESVSVGTQEAIVNTARVIGVVLGLLVNCLLAACLLAGVPRLRMPARRLVPSMLLVAIGLTMLSTAGRLYIDYSAKRPAYQVVGGAVGLLLFLYLFNQMLLFGAALAATSDHGTVQDLAAGPPPAGDTPTAAKPANLPGASR